MASTYSNLKIQLMATGENASTWGDVTNTNLGTAIEEAIVGSADVTFASGDVTLTLSDTNGTQPARNVRLNLTGTTGGSTRNLVVPGIEKPYIVNNGCADSVVVKTAAGTGVTVPTGKTMWVYCNGANVVDVVTHLSSVTLSTPLPIASGGTGNNTGSGAALTDLNASSISSGTLALARGGTGASTNSAARVNLLPSYTGNGGKILALNAGGTDVQWVAAGGAGTVTSVNATTAISGLSFSGGPVTTSGTLTLSGTLGVQGGGTGTTSHTAGAVLIGNGTSAITSVAPGTSGNVLASNGSAWVSIGGVGTGTVTSVNATTAISGLSFSGGPVTTSGTLTLSGTLGAAGGGTGLTAVGTSGNVLTSNGTAWVSQAPSGGSGVSTITFGSTGLTPSTATNGAVSVAGTLVVGNGGTGKTTHTANAVLTGNGTSAFGSVSPGTSGNVLTSNGTAWTSAAPVIGGFADGTAAAPSIYFTNDTNTGLYRYAPDTISIATGGSSRIEVSNSKVTTFNNTHIDYGGTGSNTNVQLTIGSSSNADKGPGLFTSDGYELNFVATNAAATAGTAASYTQNGTLTVVTLTQTSDITQKTDIVPLTGRGLAVVGQLNGYSFTRIQGQKSAGVLAQEVQEVLPDLVVANSEGILSVDHTAFWGYAIEAIKELSAEVEALKAQLGG